MNITIEVDTWDFPLTNWFNHLLDKSEDDDYDPDYEAELEYGNYGPVDEL